MIRAYPRQLKSELLENIPNLIEFLTTYERPLDEVLAHLTLRTFEPLECSGTILAEIRKDGILEVVSKYGLATDFFDFHPKFGNMDEELPMIDCISNQNVIYVSTLPFWGDKYPSLNKVQYPYKDKSFLCWPVEQSGLARASIGIFCKNVIDRNIDLELFLRTISNTLSIYYFRPRHYSSSFRRNRKGKINQKRKLIDGPLTARQLQILRLMALGETNNSIALTLGYSDSTIRQETMKIYSKLDCDGREAASRIYRERFAEAMV